MGLIMITCEHTQMHYFEIWQPRYHDKTVLLNKYKVGQHNKIVFTKSPSMGSEPYYVSGSVVKQCKLESNGSIMCYVVPLDKLESLEYQKNGCVHLF